MERVDRPDEELNRLAVQAQLLSRQGEALQGQISSMQSTVSELTATIDTLNNIKQAKSKGLLPVGSGVYITCKEVDTKEVLVSVGAGVITQKNIKDATEILDKRLKNLNDAMEKSQKSMIRINEQLQEINIRASIIQQRIGENVRSSQEKA